MTPETGPASEIGRELKASELTPRTVVVIKTPGKNLYDTFWVDEVNDKFVIFYAGKMRWHLINFVHPDDDTIWDDKNRQVHVYEYLGKI